MNQLRPLAQKSRIGVEMATFNIVLGFAVMFATVFGLFVIVARRQAASQDAQRELLAEKDREQAVMQAKSDDMWRANKHLRM
jgi:hypothetical protein